MAVMLLYVVTRVENVPRSLLEMGELRFLGVPWRAAAGDPMSLGAQHNVSCSLESVL